MHNARIDGLDLSSSAVTDEFRGLTGLRGVVLSRQQAVDLAPDLARHLGATVENSSERD